MMISTLIGYATRIESDNQLSQVVNILKRDKSNCLRYGVPYGSGTGRYRKSDIQYFLDQWAIPNGGVIIVDINHTYGNPTLNWNLIMNNCLMVCEDFSNNPRVFIEIANEIYGSGVVQGIIDTVNAIHNAGYTNKIVWDKHSRGTWYETGVDYNGRHFYMEGANWTVQKLQNELSAGIEDGLMPMVCTEVGAHTNEAGSFTDNNVGLLNTMIQWCTQDMGIGVLVWMNEGVSNDNAYITHGLVIPEAEPIWFDDEPQPPINLDDYYTKAEAR